jgi:hypothetical protein
MAAVPRPGACADVVAPNDALCSLAGPPLTEEAIVTIAVAAAASASPPMLAPLPHLKEVCSGSLARSDRAVRGSRCSGSCRSPSSGGRAASSPRSSMAGSSGAGKGVGEAFSLVVVASAGPSRRSQPSRRGTRNASRGRGRCSRLRRSRSSAVGGGVTSACRQSRTAGGLFCGGAARSIVDVVPRARPVI